MAKTLSSLSVQLGGDISGFRKSFGQDAPKIFARTQQSALGLGAAMKKLALPIGAAVAAIGGTAAFSKMAQSIDKTAKQAARLSSTTEIISRFGFAAEQTGTDQQALTKGLQLMQRNISDATMGVGEAKDEILALGLNANKLKAMSLDQQFATISDALKNVTNGSDRSRIAMGLFGRSGADLIPLLASGSEGMAEYARQSDMLGRTLYNTGTKKVEAMNDAFNRLKSLGIGAMQNLVIAVAPYLEKIVNYFVAFGVRARTIFSSLFAKVKGTTTGGLSFITSIFTNVYNYLVGATAKLAPTIIGYYLSLWSLAKTIWTAGVQALITVFNFLMPYLKPVFDWLINAFDSMLKGITYAINAITYTLQNLKSIFEFVGAKLVYSVVKTANEIKHQFTTVIPSYLNWFASNWQNILITFGANTLTFFENLSSNIVSIMSNLPSLISGSVSFGELWQPLSDGFVNVIEKLPDIPARVATDFESALGNEADSLGKNLKNNFNDFMKSKEKEAADSYKNIADFAGSLDFSIKDTLPKKIEVDDFQIDENQTQEDKAAKDNEMKLPPALLAGSAEATRFAQLAAARARRTDKDDRVEKAINVGNEQLKIIATNTTNQAPQVVSIP